MSGYTIKSRAGATLFVSNDSSVREAVEEARARGVSLRGSDLRGSDLRGSNLRGSDLRGSNLRGSNLSDSNLRGAVNAGLIQARTLITPAGAITGWKKCRGGVIVELKIPAKAKRSNATGRKCRAEYAKVVAIHRADTAQSEHDPKFTYRVGETVRPTEPFDDNRWNECASGIHFYLTREEAEAH